MLPPVDRDQLHALLDDVHQKARARGDSHVPDGFVPDYWYGVATGYQDAAERIEAFLK